MLASIVLLVAVDGVLSAGFRPRRPPWNETRCEGGIVAAARRAPRLCVVRDRWRDEFVMRVNSTVGWEPRTRLLLRRLLLREPPGSHVFEAGAHVGDHLLPMAAAFPSLRFVGLDPDASKCAFIERMADANRLRNVRVVTAALDAVERTDCGLDRAGLPGMWRVGSNGTEEGLCTTIDAVMANATTIAVVHLDLEGFEFRAMLGANATLSRAPNVVFENDHGDDPDGVVAHLTTLGFTKLDEVEHNEHWGRREVDDGDDGGGDDDDDDDVTEAPTPQRGGERQRAQRLRARSRASPLP